MCVEALQTLEKETNALEEAQRSLLDTQDCLDKQKDDLQLDKIKAEVSGGPTNERSLPKSNRISLFFVLSLECKAPTPACVRESRTREADYRGQARLEPQSDPAARERLHCHGQGKERR